MIAGHLQIKNDYYYMVLSYLDANGKRKQPWFPTGLPIKNNKKRAEKMLLELRQTYVPPAEHKSNGELSADMLFADFMELWLGVVRNSIEKTTFSSYTQMVKGKIAPYFRKTGIKLGEHFSYADKTPLSNLWLTILNGAVVKCEKFGGSTGTLDCVVS